MNESSQVSYGPNAILTTMIHSQPGSNRGILDYDIVVSVVNLTDTPIEYGYGKISIWPYITSGKIRKKMFATHIISSTFLYSERSTSDSVLKAFSRLC